MGTRKTELKTPCSPRTFQKVLLLRLDRILGFAKGS